MFNCKPRSGEKLSMKKVLLWSGVISLGATVGILSLAVFLNEPPKSAGVMPAKTGIESAPSSAAQGDKTPLKVVVDSSTDEPATTSAPAPTAPLTQEEIFAKYEKTTITAASPLKVEWFGAKSRLSDSMLSQMFGDHDQGGKAKGIIDEAYAIGDVAGAGQLHVMLASPACNSEEMMCGSRFLYYFTWQPGSKPVLLSKISEVPPLEFADVFSLDAATTVASPAVPATLKTPSGRATFVRSENAWGATKFIEDYAQPKILFTDAAGRRFYTSGNCYVLEDTDFTTVPYELALAALNPSESSQLMVSPNITYVDGTKNTTTYEAADPATRSCGSGGCLDAIGPTLDMNAVTLTGHLPNGQAIYEPKLDVPGALADKLKSMFESRINREALTDMNAFMAIHPLLLWKGPFGEWIKLKNVEAQMMAECGKPVIYLYPERETVASVQVAPNGGFTKTEPAYGEGWRVLARPDGRLTDLRGGADWPYLFWEGHAFGYMRPNEGFMVRRERVDAFLAKALAQQGLNAKEAADFREFWVPKMQAKPYYFVTFVPQAAFEKLAPLTVEPKPDTVIRVFMDYEPLDAPVSVRPQRLSAPERRGFTVVEWGGQLRH
jgi:hypothetical protein